jgi:hypothetical protein
MQAKQVILRAVGSGGELCFQDDDLKAGICPGGVVPIARRISWAAFLLFSGSCVDRRGEEPLADGGISSQADVEGEKKTPLVRGCSVTGWFASSAVS